LERSDGRPFATPQPSAYPAAVHLHGRQGKGMARKVSPRGRCILLLLALVVTPAPAQWSDDPAHNLVVSDRPGYQSRPRIAASPDGGFYIGWEDPNLPARLQRLDAAGRELWPHNGIGIAAAGLLGLAVDGSGNALVAARLASAYALLKIGPDGSHAWPEEGVVLANGVLGKLVVTATSDGGVACLWGEAQGLRLQKFDAAGACRRGAAVLPSRTRHPFTSRSRGWSPPMRAA
jgi:hypothetical protein